MTWFSFNRGSVILIEGIRSGLPLFAVVSVMNYQRHHPSAHGCGKRINVLAFGLRKKTIGKEGQTGQSSYYIGQIRANISIHKEDVD